MVFDTQFWGVGPPPLFLPDETFQELSISLLKNTRPIVFEGCFESSKFLLATVALESRFSLTAWIVLQVLNQF
jgi:hypothetical protein